MQITDLTSSYQLTLEQVRSNLLDSLRAGQLLPARVLTPTAHNRVTLQIAGLQLAARTSIPLAQGENLLLKVLKPAHPLQLQLVREVTASQSQASAVRAALPREIPITDLVARLRSLVEGPPPSATTGVPPAKTTHPQAVVSETPKQGPQSSQPTARTDVLRLVSEQGQQVERLLNTIQQVLGHQLTQAQTLNSDQLRRFFSGSGLFLEATLAAGEKPFNDLKAGLIELLSRLRPQLENTRVMGTQVQTGQIDRPPTTSGSPSQFSRLLMELFSHTEGSLARILMNQLASLPSADSDQQYWQFELPVWDGEQHSAFDIRIGRERAGDQEEWEHNWSVGLNFNLEPLGPVKAQLTLSGDEVSSYFTAERPESVRKISRALPVLNQAFLRAGLSIGRMVAAQGKTDSRSAPPFPLLDEKA